MKNLKLLSADVKTSEAGDCFCLDMDKNTYIVSDESILMLDHECGTLDFCDELVSEVQGSNHHYAVGMEYIFESNCIFIATSSGDLYTYNIDDQKVTCVGVVETCVEGFSWSADQELLVLLTGNNSLILMTKEFDAITEKSLCPDEFGESKPINVGWGSKTTQFHGSEGKEAAVVKKKELKPALAHDDRKPRISWRRDGEYFVTSSIDDKDFRQLRIWSQEGVLQFTGEAIEGLEEPICWRPLGNVIACSQQCPNKHKIIFIEKNGLQHGEFSLPFQPNTYKVSTLTWNSDSSILLIVAEEIVNPANFEVMLWSSSNYHWYLKQRFQLPNSSPIKPLVSKWSMFHPNELQCYNPSDGELYSFKFAWTLLQTSYGCEDSLSVSIDNENILVSPFGKLLVPPPLSAYKYTMSASVQSVFFSPDGLAFGAYLSNGLLAFYQAGKDDLPSNVPECKLQLVAAGGNGFRSQVKPYSFLGLIGTDLKSDIESSFGLNHFTWMEGQKLLFTCFCYEKSRFSLLSADIPLSLEKKIVPAKFVTDLDTSVVAMCVNPSGSVVAIQQDNGCILKAISDNNSIVTSPWTGNYEKPLIFPQPCSVMSVISISGKDYVLGLSEKFSLFCNEIVLLNNCTSYYVTDEFLLVTTIDHVLKCFSIEHDVANAIKMNNSLPSEVQSQKIEKSARIIMAPTNSTKVILQMPRGNLETIHPRPLVLSKICKLIERLEFGKAFNLSKEHRIDLNVLHDHSPQLFLGNIEKVFEQIPKSSDLNLLIASLKNEDVCVTMYPLVFQQKLHEVGQCSDKINTVCDAFRSVLDKKTTNEYYHTLMATYAKKTPSEVDQALLRLKNLKESESLKSTQNLVDSALNFLLYLIDVNELMDVALGTYDLETTIMVAQKSQKDPKEFLPFYNELQNLEENYRKFKIDMHLKRYKRALLHISKCDDKFDECISLIKEQRLYVDALQLFPHLSDQYKAVWKEYGNYLMGKRHYDEAGLVFSRCGEHERALSAYEESLNWEMVLYEASQLGYSDSNIVSKCASLASKMQMEQKFKDAAYLWEHYVKDVERSIETLIEGHEWNAALLMISKYQRKDIIETHFKPVLKEYHQYLSSHIDQLTKDFNEHLDRLKFLRTQKKKEAENPSIIKCNENDLFSETGSVSEVASSVVSSKVSGSIMTRKSSKSRRKQKLKKYRLKEGSANEDLAHIVALSEIVTKVDSVKDNFLSTLRALVQFGFDAPAQKLQTQMHDLVEKIQGEMSYIWNPVENTAPASDVKFGPDSTVNSIVASLQQKGDNAEAAPQQIDPELAAPLWRRNIEISLQMFN